MEVQTLKDWLTGVVKGLVSNKDSIEIKHTVDDQGVLFSLKVHDADIGMVIGKAGNTANALRTLLRSVGMTYDIRVSMIVDVPGSNYVQKV